MRKPGFVVWVLLSAWSLALIACGGGSSAPDRLTIDPPSATVEYDADVVLHANAVFGTTIKDAGVAVTWDTADATKVRVTKNADGSATVHGLAAGATTVAVHLDTLTASAAITVGAAPIVSIGVTPANPSLAQGTMAPLIATATFADSSTQNITATATWASANPTIAAVAADGMVRAVGLGSTMISATKGGVTGSTAVTVTDATLTMIAVTPTNPSVPRGRTVQLTATGTFTNGTTQNLTAMVTWSSADAAKVSVNAAGLATGAGVGTIAVTATLGAVSGATAVTVTNANLIALAVTPVNPSIARGRLQQFTATGTYSDATTLDLTGVVAWTSSNQVIATISNVAGTAGQATAIDPGTSVITATLGAFTDSTVLTVTAAVLDSIAITPPNPSIAAGRTQQFAATGTFSDATTLDLTGTVAWSSSAETVATISNAAGSRGLASATTAGPTTITATSGAVSGTTVLTVTAAELLSIGVTPVNPSLAKGRTRPFTAMGTFSDTSVVDLTNTVTWLSTNDAIATVSNAAGSHGLATAVGVGAVTVRATSGAVAGQTTLTVTAAELVSIGVTPAAPSVAKGRPQQFTATGVFTDASVLNLTDSVTWSTTAATVATVANAAGSHGLASTLAVGATDVIATSGAIHGQTTLTVTPAVLVSIGVTPAAPSVPSGHDQQFTAMGTFSDATTLDLTDTVTWASTDAGVAAISNAAGSHGLAATLSPGNVVISATSGAIVGTTTLTVTDAVLESIEVGPVDTSVAAGRTQQFSATGVYSDHTTQDITAQVAWSSDDDSLASASNDPASVGLVSTFLPGAVQITATVGLISGSAGLTVTDAELNSNEVAPANPAIAAGLDQQFSATGTFSDNTTQDLTTQVTWTSADDTIATVSNAGESQGLAHSLVTGTVAITAELGGVTGATDLEVTPAELVELTIEPLVNPPLPAGLTRAYGATGRFTDGSILDLTTQVTWASSDDTVLAISNAGGSEGLATALIIGTVTITATSGAVVGTTTTDVSAAVLQAIEVTPADGTVAIGRGPLFTATGTYSDLSIVDITQQVTWSSSDQGIVSVANGPGNHGQSTTHAVGTATISADLDGITGTTTLTVTDAVLVAIEVAPSLPSVALGRPQAFVATGLYSDSSSANLTDQVLWQSSVVGVATISNVAPNRGVAASVAPGVTTISATLDGQTGQTDLTVTAAVLDSIAVSPVAPSLANGRNTQMKADGTYSDGTIVDVTNQVVWSTGAIAVATISNAAGTHGRLHAASPGQTSVDATLDGVTGSATVTVTPAVLDTLAVTPDPGALPAGRTLQLKAEGTFSDGGVLDLTGSVTWTTTTPVTLSVSNAAPKGLVTGLVAGIGAVRATDVASGVFDNDVVTVSAAVLDSIAVSPLTAAVAVAGTKQFTATGTYSNATVRDITNDADTLWTTSDAAVATISNAGGGKGVGTGVALGGPVTIKAAQAGKEGSAQLTVGVVPTVMTVTPANAAVNVAVGTSVVVTFATAMTPATVTTQSIGGACSGAIQLSKDDFVTCLGLGAPVMTVGNTVATLAAAPGMSYGQTYKVKVTTAAQSAGGLPLAAAVVQAAGFTTVTERPCGAGLIISQVYGGGGNTLAPYTNDFVELHNTGTANAATNGMAIQYSSAASVGATNWLPFALPNATVAPGGYYLVQFASGGAVGVALPAPDATMVASPTNMSATAGKVALTNTTVTLQGTTMTAAVVDMVGYGTTANTFEGGGVAPAPSNTTAVARLNGGCADGNSNNLDFSVIAPTPRNAMTPAVLCSCTVNETGVAAEMDYCNLQFPASTSTAKNVATENIFTQVFETGVTEAAGIGAGIACQVGYGASTVNPETTPSGYTWTNGAFNVQVGNNDELKATLTVPIAGSYKYTSRCTRDGTNWTYCDLNGAGANANLVFDLLQLGALTVTP